MSKEVKVTAHRYHKKRKWTYIFAGEVKMFLKNIEKKYPTFLTSIEVNIKTMNSISDLSQFEKINKMKKKKKRKKKQRF